MKQEMLQFCTQKGIILDKPLLELLSNLSDSNIAKNILEKITFQYKQKVITKKFFSDNQDNLYSLLSYSYGKNQDAINQLFVSLGIDLKNKQEKAILVKNDLDSPKLEHSSVPVITLFENNPKKMEVKDFVNNFRNRYIELKNILQQRNSLENLTSINRIGNNSSFSLIGLVFEKRITKNGNVMLEIEDLTGKISVLINKNREDVFEKSKEIVLDEVIGLKCSGNGEIVFVNDVVFPDSLVIEKKYSKIEELAVFTSDIHVGSDKFLKKNFSKFVDWINGNVGTAQQREEALKVKYLFITGDTIDGVGVYPGQETQLALKDVDEQYSKLLTYLLKIRPDIRIFLCPGQHDAVRVAEPQPAVGEFYGKELRSVNNLSLVTNPAIVEIGKDVKFKVLMYHGASMHGLINNIDALRLNKAHDSPTSVVKYLLKKRHLAPMHSLVTYTPLEDRDALLIKETPDIVSTGDLHRPEVSEYNGTILIASSCWQAKTPFEEKVGNNPDPCKVPVLNLKTREVKIIDFSEGLDKSGNVLDKSILEEEHGN